MKRSASPTASGKSQKAQKAADLNRAGPKLHAHVTSFSPSGLGEALASKQGRALGQGKRVIWQGILQGDFASVASSSSSSSRSPPSVHPAVEALRLQKVRRLQKTFLDDCASASGPPPSLAFERWLLNSIGSSAIGSSSAAGRDPLLPPALLPSTDASLSPHVQRGLRPSETGLIADLTRASLSAADAEAVVVRLATSAAAAAGEVAEASKRHKKQKASSKAYSSSCGVRVERHAHTLSISLADQSGGGGGRKHLLKLNHEHYAKLSQLWERQRELTQMDEGGSDSDPEDEQGGDGGSSSSSSGGSSSSSW